MSYTFTHDTFGHDEWIYDDRIIEILGLKIYWPKLKAITHWEKVIKRRDDSARIIEEVYGYSELKYQAERKE